MSLEGSILRALVLEEGDVVELQLLDLDVAVLSGSVEGAILELSRSLNVLYQAAEKEGLEPFVSTYPAPRHLWAKWSYREDDGGDDYPVDLRPEVSRSLASVLNKRRPVDRVRVQKIRTPISG